AHGSFTADGVEGTDVRRSVAGLHDVATTGCRPAHGRAFRIGRTVGSGAGASLERIADALRTAADLGGRNEMVRGTVCARAGAGFLPVAVASGRPTDAALDELIRRTGRGRSVAEFRAVAAACDRAALVAGIVNGLARAIVVLAVAGLDNV